MPIIAKTTTKVITQKSISTLCKSILLNVLHALEQRAAANNGIPTLEKIEKYGVDAIIQTYRAASFETTAEADESMANTLKDLSDKERDSLWKSLSRISN